MLANHPQPFAHSFAAMTTQCALTFYGVSQTQGTEIALAIEQRVMWLVQRYNFHSADSWLTRAVNHRSSNTVAIDEELATVLTTVREHAKNFCDVFDITVGTYADRVKKAKSSREVADAKKQLQRYTGAARWAVVSSDGNHSLQFDNSVTRIDLGGVIKEYAVDESARIAKAAGVEAGIVNYGGDLSCWGLKPGGERFVAGIPDPRAPEKMLFGLDLLDQALTTSGHYARSRTLKDGSVSHIVGASQSSHQIPTFSPWLSCSVVSKSALVSGIYSTALLIASQQSAATYLPPEALAIVVDQHGGVQRLN